VVVSLTRFITACRAPTTVEQAIDVYIVRLRFVPLRQRKGLLFKTHARCKACKTLVTLKNKKLITTKEKEKAVFNKRLQDETLASDTRMEGKRFALSASRKRHHQSLFQAQAAAGKQVLPLTKMP
jgi:hypothetical protein